MTTWIANNLLANNKLISKKCNKQWFIKNHCIDKFDEICRLTVFLVNPTFPQRIWHIVNNTYNTHTCKATGCNNPTSFLTFTRGYLDTCSSRCAQLNPATVFKIKNTNLSKYGTEYGLSNKDIIAKKINTCLKNHGVNNPTKSRKILDKIANGNREKYGVSWILEDQGKKESAIQSKYGVRNIQQSDEFKTKTAITRKSMFYDSLLSSDRLKNRVIPLFSKDEYLKLGCNTEYKFQCIKCNSIFPDSLEDGDVPRCPVCYKNASIFETEVMEFIKLSLPLVELTQNTKDVISPLELDVYIPSLKIAIECNGLYWHGEINGGKSKKYHLSKTIECEKLGIRLIHIFEDEWLFKKDIVKSRLLGLFNITKNKIYARKCVIQEIDSKTSNLFLETNHIQGSDTASVRYGLFYNNVLSSVMTFGKPRISLGNASKNNSTWELYRFCSMLNTTVIGGASKLLSHFIKIHTPSCIITYADRRWSIGNVYNTLGFVKKSDGTPNYWYFGKGNSYRRHHRYAYAKHTLHKKLGTFDPNLTEWENMKQNGFDRIWDCGSIKFELMC